MNMNRVRLKLLISSLTYRQNFRQAQLVIGVDMDEATMDRLHKTMRGLK
jgi:hypothetical protein